MTSCLPEVFVAFTKVGITSVADMSGSHEGKVEKLRDLEAASQLGVRIEACLKRAEFIPVAQRNNKLGMVRLGV